MLKRVVSIACVVVLCGALAGCGSSRLSAQDNASVSRALSGIAAICADQLIGHTSAQDTTGATNGADDLIAVYRKDPQANYRAPHRNVTMRKLLSNVIDEAKTCRISGIARAFGNVLKGD